MSFYQYKTAVSEGARPAIKVEWLNDDETVRHEFTNDLYDINASVDVNKQSGCRRTCSLRLNNENNKFPVGVYNIWIGQKFKLWMGVYLNDGTPYLFPQGVFYVSNPSEAFTPTEKTMTISGIDKWAFLDGTLHGVLAGSYQTNVNVNLYSAIKELLKLPSEKGVPISINKTNINTYFDVSHYNGGFIPTNSSANCSDFEAYFYDSSNRTSSTSLTAKQDMKIAVMCGLSTSNSAFTDYLLYVNDKKVFETKEKYYKKHYFTFKKGDILKFEFGLSRNQKGTGSFNDMVITPITPIDPIPPFLAPSLETKTTIVKEEEKPVIECPYTATVERGKTYADVILEYATILCANVYYDADGRFTLTPMIDTADDITDTNKEILWDYTVDEKTFLGITQSYNFDKIYNDFIVLGNITNGYQFKGRVQNRNPLSNTCVQEIGLKTKAPYENNQYVSDEQCVELAKYYAKTETIMQRSGTIPSITLYHLDVDKLITVSTPNNNMSRELFLINGYSLSTSGTMSLNVVSVNILDDFSVAEVEVYE